MKIALHDEHRLLDRFEFSKHVELSTLKDADCLVAVNEDLGFDKGKTVLLMMEPYGVDGSEEYFDRSEEYLMFATYDRSRCRELFFCKDASVWPMEPVHRLRQNTMGSLSDRSVYFAGQTFGSKSDGKTIYHLRKRIVSGLEKRGLHVFAVGRGFSGQTANNFSRIVTVRVAKMREIVSTGTAFVLCMENTITPGYVSEKFHDGILSRRVPLYLGCPNIEDYVPTDMFVDLRDFYDGDTVDIDGVFDRLMTMTEDEYGSILAAGESWLNTFDNGAFAVWQKRMCRRILKLLGVEGVSE